MPPRGDRAAVIIVREGNLLLLRRRKLGERYDALPGGTIEPGETPEAAAIREIREETSLRVRLAGPVLTLENEGRRETYFDAVEAVGEPVLGGPEACRNSKANSYALNWVALGKIPRRPLRPLALRVWLAARDWGEVRGISGS
jgi:ADP-ribose pyrophosphatase YjhB (NUDIX family)